MQNRLGNNFDQLGRGVPMGAAWTPASIASLSDWLYPPQKAYSDAGTTLCNAGDSVRQWTSLSASARSVTETTNKPTWQSTYLSFASASSQTLTGTSSFGRLGGADGTVSLWFAPTSQTLQAICGANDGGSPDWHVNYRSDSHVLGARTWSGSGYQTLSYSVTLTINAWHHVLLRYYHGSTTLQMWLNGTQVATATRTLAGGTDVFRIANTADGFTRFDGKFGEFVCCAAAITDLEIANLYARTPL